MFYRLLRHNFNRHFSTNRAPLGLNFHASWLKSKREFREELVKFIDEMLARNDVYFVTMLQVNRMHNVILDILNVYNVINIRLSNGCKTQLNSLPLEIFKNGKKNVMSKVNLIVLFQTLVHSLLENFLEKHCVFLLVWNVLVIILGFWTLPEMELLFKQFVKIRLLRKKQRVGSVHMYVYERNENEMMSYSYK